MLDTRVRKIFGDVAVEGSRSVLAVLAIAIGVFAFGSVLDARSILVRELDANYRRTKPSASVLELSREGGSPSVDPGLIETIEKVEGVKDVSLSGEFAARVRVSGGEWRALRLFTLPDYLNQRADVVTSVSGSWPPREGEALIEKAAVSLLGSAGANELEINLGDGVARPVKNAGVVHAPGLPPAWMERTAYAWVSAKTLESWGVRSPMNRVRIHVAGNALDAAHIAEVSARARDAAEKAGVAVSHVSIPEPGHHPHASQMLTLLYLLESFGFLAMALASILAASVISSLMGRQLRQIAIMKAVGGTARQIRAMYFGKIALFSLASCLAAIPLANVAALAYSRFAAATLNFTIFDATVPRGAYIAEIAVAFAAPLAIASFSVVKGSRVTVKEALADSPAIYPSSGTGRNSALRGRFSRPLILSLRNSARKPVRMALSILTLAAAGAMFMTAMNIGASMDETVASKFRASRYDLRLMFPVAVDDSVLRGLADAVDGVETLETWGYNPVFAVSGNGTESERIDLISIPDETVLQARPPLAEGRWLEPGDTDAVVVNQRVVGLLETPRLGATVTLRAAGMAREFRIIGIVKELMAAPTAYANKASVDSALGQTGRSKSIAVRGAAHDRAFAASLAKRLEAALGARGIPVTSSTLLLEFQLAVRAHFAVIASMLTLMALLVVIVGVLGLSSAMGITVLERTRELGILRAIGATGRSVVMLVVIEGVIIGIASWVLAVAASYPVSAFIARRFGLLFFEAPLEFAVSVTGMFAWLAIVVVCAALSSYAPSSVAARAPIREALAWE
ncbi:MAG TPA: ABC transporter permease [Treponemataceae bacterium]|mgnify:CR=1 FL=1|nr:ABC transporter permease [Treponemataceae bacterium]